MAGTPPGEGASRGAATGSSTGGAAAAAATCKTRAGVATDDGRSFLGLGRGRSAHSVGARGGGAGSDQGSDRGGSIPRDLDQGNSHRSNPQGGRKRGGVSDGPQRSHLGRGQSARSGGDRGSDWEGYARGGLAWGGIVHQDDARGLDRGSSSVSDPQDGGPVRNDGSGGCEGPSHLGLGRSRSPGRPRGNTHGSNLQARGGRGDGCSHLGLSRSRNRASDRERRCPGPAARASTGGSATVVTRRTGAP